MLEIIKKEYFKIDVLINNAGIAKDQITDMKNANDFKEVLNTNLIGPFLTCKIIGKYMEENEYGNIINISSTNGIDTYYPEGMDYDASKAGLNSLTMNFATLYAPKIRVNAVAPGWIETEMNKDISEDFRKKEEEKILIERFANPKEIANVVYFLSQDEASYINATIIRVDGGIKR